MPGVRDGSWRRYTPRMRGGCLTKLGGCLVKMVLFCVAAGAFFWVLMIAMNPWALHIGERSTPFLNWEGWGLLRAKDGKVYPLFVSFGPGEPAGFSGAGRREGKRKSADLTGTGRLCLAPGKTERMKISGEMYGGYKNSEESLFSFRLLEWTGPFSMNSPNRGFFDVAGSWHGQELVMDRPGEQGVKLTTGPLIDHATVTLRWADKAAFESACRNMGRGVQ